MRLKYIKLAGFKSFVDPTKVLFEQQMTAIVGPNGCGKSNIIDAVRWVLGESSAKNLRGDAMTDVIFNGSTSRKPIGQASVELLFDNAQGRLQGNMADRSQVSIRRVVNREGSNTYYLNGSKCRRRDITEIFLGTGLGPRSYAIIEQGTISRLIESKPQELRVFIEEAAGISKYKERRRETELRIKHTRENLTRLTDIRMELAGQIDKLHQQAQAAKRFRTLKQQERKYKAELAVLRWQKFEQQRQQHHTQILSLESKVAEQTALISKTELQIIGYKEATHEASEKQQLLQREKLVLSQNITRNEQDIKHISEQADRVQQDESLTQQQLINTQQLILSEQKSLHDCSERLNQQQPQLRHLECELEQCQQLMNDLQQQQVQIQQQWQQQQADLAQYHQQKLIINAEMTEQQTLLTQLASQITEFEQEQLTDVQNYQVEIEQFSKQKEEYLAEKQRLDQQYQMLISEREQLQQNHRQVNQQIFEQQTVHRTKKQAIEKMTLQLSKNAQWYDLQQEYLATLKLSTHAKFNAQLTVDSTWQVAADKVLNSYLQSDIIDKHPSANNNDELPLSRSQFIICNEQALKTKTPAKANTLASKIHGCDVLNYQLNNIYLAENYHIALSMLDSLTVEQSIICKDGTWVSKHMLLKGSSDEHSQFFQQKGELLQEQNALEKSIQALSVLQAEQQQAEEKLTGTEQQCETLGENIKRNNDVVVETEQKLQRLIQAQAFIQQRQAKLDEQLSLAKDKKLLAEQKLSAAKFELTKLTDNHQQDNSLSEQQNTLATQLEIQQKNSQQLHHQRHQLALTIEQLKSKKNQHEQVITNNQNSIHMLNQQKVDNEKSIIHQTQTLPKLQGELQKLLNDVALIDHELQRTQKLLNDHTTYLAEADLAIKSAQHKVSSFTKNLNQLQLDSEAFKLRSENALDALSDLKVSVESVLETIPTHAKENIWQAHISKLAKDIQLLGAINLAAIDEYETQFERKNYLDQQDQDLTQAISTLESAISKIDRETRHKFKVTFERVNNDLKRLFPKVFGGGQAYLALTEDDLLETGVSIMARPPGKKNSTIHLLSGGEKALTALSLVFAIFRLNPAPFCLLDEVDAPFDDANVLRFCNLVREMSQTVQFIYISHNKIAMEMASHLTGVTMFEPGVSRMVSVDIDEAVAMAEI